jgi:Short-chain fatty acyl coenzyme A regulators
MNESKDSPFPEFLRHINSDEWRTIARGLHSHLSQTGRRQKDLAAQAQMAVSNLSAYLNLHRTPSAQTVTRILSAAMKTHGVTAAMIEHWRRQPDSQEIHFRDRLKDLEEMGITFSASQQQSMLTATASNRTLAGAFIKMTDEIRSLGTRSAQLALAHTDAARESLLQSAVEAFQLAPGTRHFTKAIEKDIRQLHNDERKAQVTTEEMVNTMLAEEKIKIERVAPTSPRTGRGRWEGLKWLLSLKDQKRATITTGIPPDQYPFELGRVLGHMRMQRLFGSAGQKEIEQFVRNWVAKNFPQSESDPAEREQIEQDITWLVFRSLAGRWTTGLYTLPVDRFVKLSESCLYDIDRIAATLNTSWETVANRISQLDVGLPVHFIKMDWRGVVLKRSSFSGLTFAPLYMRVCGRWASARSLLMFHGSIFRQHSMFPDWNDQTYFCVGRSLRAPSLHFQAAPLVYSITLGVNAADAHRMVYAQNFNSPPVECGSTCRLCSVLNCENRVCPSAEFPGIGKFDYNVIWSGKTIHERMPNQAIDRRPEEW